MLVETTKVTVNHISLATNHLFSFTCTGVTFVPFIYLTVQKSTFVIVGAVVPISVITIVLLIVVSVCLR